MTDRQERRERIDELTGGRYRAAWRDGVRSDREIERRSQRVAMADALRALHRLTRIETETAARAVGVIEIDRGFPRVWAGLRSRIREARTRSERLEAEHCLLTVMVSRVPVGATA